MIKKSLSTNNRRLKCSYLPRHWALHQHQHKCPEVFEKCYDRYFLGAVQGKHVLILSVSALASWSVFFFLFVITCFEKCFTHPQLRDFDWIGNFKRCLTTIYTRLKLWFNSFDQSDFVVGKNNSRRKQASLFWPPKKWFAYDNRDGGGE